MDPVRFGVGLAVGFPGRAALDRLLPDGLAVCCFSLVPPPVLPPPLPFPAPPEPAVLPPDPVAPLEPFEPIEPIEPPVPSCTLERDSACATQLE